MHLNYRKEALDIFNYCLHYQPKIHNRTVNISSFNEVLKHISIMVRRIFCFIILSICKGRTKKKKSCKIPLYVIICMCVVLKYEWH